MKIPLSSPDISQAERDAVAEVMLTSQLSLGPRLPEFERLLSEYVGVRYAVAVNSGTSALHLCIRAMGIGPGDEVITTSFSFIATANCILMEGARPVFVDIDPETWNIDPAKIEAAITPRARAILPVHVFGLPPDMDAILAIARKHNLRVLEDSCEALGATYKGRRAGSLCDAGVFGFYPNKQITTGEGGMIVTNDETIYRLATSMRNQGRGVNSGWLAHERLGYNFRLSDINCALGIAQMKRIDEILAHRAQVAKWYHERLGDEKRISLQRVPSDRTISHFVMVARLSDDYTREDRDCIMEGLRAKEIGTNNYFSPIHLQPFYAEQGWKRGDLPVCEALSDRTIALPFHGLLTEQEVDTVCREFRALLSRPYRA
ncbi:MAG TPA: DegT/DnrJ/EryC1/StrS family aminotransferase [Phycisphaerae bacterium]|jgi:perosamine synthetase|nr:DegT/DnrJ/EryC1/StrS family aminotransferase [Phycisphaerae bacterium]HOB73196.1 DegT/DnrJ/EryC1/StrS family aminotransferase [Phycisphaerae bacterium]HOJ55109.1 DegT/DnrJ/EryC1/StrS family aminotransferase [Phycisphaerae bacterium]HOL27925.1 DegT/DnrJ/EryC1/StrS family aminotransferase [Phycisphaerae bacterium]HPP21732.1 DegT/DnrJ/EryC1/StrS family aminotransferase [Phycisphaerae bacterium]